MEIKDNFFTCRCPSDLKNGVDGFYHLVPIHCVDTLSKEEVAEIRRTRASTIRDRKKDVIFTAAIMDAFHNGHKNIIDEMRKRGDTVIVVLHTDFACYEIKGKFPIQNIAQRMHNVYMAGADIVIPCDDVDPAVEFHYILNWFPDAVFLRGDDNLNPPGKCFLDEMGVKQIYIPYTKDISSTKRRKEYE